MLLQADRVDEYLDESIQCISMLRNQRDKLYSFIEMLVKVRESDGIIYIIGNGGSASTASHFACDLNKTSIVQSEKRFRAISLVDNIPVNTAWSNDASYESALQEQLKNFLRPVDLVIAISGSGNSKNILNAVKFARGMNVSVVGLTGFEGGLLKEYCNLCIIIPSNSMFRIEDMHLTINHIIAFFFTGGRYI